MDELKDMIDIVLCTTSGVMEHKEFRDDIEQELSLKLQEFLNHHEGLDKIRVPAAFLTSFLRRHVLTCLHKIYSELKPDQLPLTEGEWTRLEDGMIELKSDLAMQLKELGKEREARLVQWLENKGNKESLFYLNLFTESFHDYLLGIRTNKDQFAPVKDWELDRKIGREKMAQKRSRIGSLIRTKPYLRKARFSKKTR
jgi:hypothetical protein